MALRTRILLIEDESALAASLQRVLEDDGYDVQPAPSPEAALNLLAGGDAFAAVISNLAERGTDSALLLEHIKRVRPGLPVLWMTGDVAARGTSMPLRPSGSDFLIARSDAEELRRSIRRLAMPGADEDAASAPRPRVEDAFDVLVGESHAMQSVRDAIARVAHVDSTVLIQGETGTGKDLVARLIHRASPRRERPLVTIDCSSIPADLLEAELFGEERLAFPGGTGVRKGRLEEAEGGTILLDEIGDLPRAIQPRILHFLQDRSVRRLGSLRDRVVNVRVIAATQRNLTEAITAGEFRADLYFRLAAVPIELPPLRSHPEDLAALCAHAVARLSGQLGRPGVQISREALEALARYAFPGNVRELENLVERALVLGAGDEAGRQIEVTDLPEHVVSVQSLPSRVMPLERGFALLEEMQAQLERDLIIRAIRRWPDLSNTQIAARLGTNRRILELRMKQYRISKKPSGATA